MPASSDLRLPESVQPSLRCPVCRGRLQRETAALVCADAACTCRFPIVNGVPVLINEATSVFAINDYLSEQMTTFNMGESRLSRLIGRLTPSISRNIKAEANYARLAQLLAAAAAAPRLLVVGGSVVGEGMASLLANDHLEIVESDVSFGPRTTLICDAHDIPFEAETFDGVVAQAVLEHVADPQRCVAEIYRVLKPAGLVYAETPFMQQAHMVPYDFTRFTHLGHRRLFRRFEELDSGAVCGPGMALAWSVVYFLLSFSTSRLLRRLLKTLGSLATFWLKYLDGYLVGKPGALDAASGFYFLGRKAEKEIADRELIKLYRGALLRR